MSEQITLKYRWRKTWPDTEDDFVGHDGETTIGRFYLHRAAEGLRWSWHMQAGGNDREHVNLSGLAETAREAAREIETNYDRLMAIYAEGARRGAGKRLIPITLKGVLPARRAKAR